MTEKKILNRGLLFAMEFGKNWLQPIQGRLSKKYPFLSESELNEYNTICQEAMKAGHDIVYSLAGKDGKDTKYEDFERMFSPNYPWVNKKCLKKLFSQGMYYSWKDGFTGT